MWAMDNRDMFSGKSEIASSDVFKRSLEMIYLFIYSLISYDHGYGY